MAIEFPSGCIAHFNTPIANGELHRAIFPSAREYSVQGAGAMVVLRDEAGVLCGLLSLANVACIMPLDTIAPSAEPKL